MEGRVWFVELSRPGVCVGDRVARGGIALYLARNAIPAIRKLAAIAFGLVLVIVQIGDTYVPRTPLTDKATVTGVWVFYTLFVLIAFAVEKVGTRTKSNTP